MRVCLSRLGIGALLALAWTACSPFTADTPTDADAGAGTEGGAADASTDAGAVDGSVDGSAAGDAGIVGLQSCATPGDGLTNCGPSAESCCTSLAVTGGTFSRSYDGNSPGYSDPQYKATVADFRLDKYEVTVGRFRKFVDAVVGGWTPPAGSGKHTHLNGGSGLAAGGGKFETGWDTAWNTNLPSSKDAWGSPAELAYNSAYATWTPTAGSNERHPITYIGWYDAAAFCIWDGGFLPSEAEWNYAAAGGNQQRMYPWLSATGVTSITEADAVYCSAGQGQCGGTQNVGSKSSLGDGRYGQTDLAGNAWEWVLDGYKAPYNETMCTNCAYLTAESGWVGRGGSVYDVAADLLNGRRISYTLATPRGFNLGARCARPPP